MKIDQREAAEPTYDISAYRRMHAPEKEEDFMSNIFSAMDAVKPLAKAAKSVPPRRNKRKSSPIHPTAPDYELRSHPRDESNVWRDGPDKSDPSSNGEPLLRSTPTRPPIPNPPNLTYD